MGSHLFHSDYGQLEILVKHYTVQASSCLGSLDSQRPHNLGDFALVEGQGDILGVLRRPDSYTHVLILGHQLLLQRCHHVRLPVHKDDVGGSELVDELRSLDEIRMG